MSDIGILEKIKQAETDSEKEIKDAEEEARAKLIEAHAEAEENLKAGIESADLAYQKEIAAAEADAARRANEVYESKIAEIKVLKKSSDEDIMNMFSDAVNEEFGV